MIRLNAEMTLKEGADFEELIQAALELAEYSRQDKGCVDYDIFQSATDPRRLLIFETWESEETLAAHSHAPHFLRLVPLLRQLSRMNTRRFEF